MNEFNQRKKTVLIVEDEFVNREILSNILEDHYNILTAEDGQEGLDVLDANKNILSLVLLDLQLPKVTGFEILKHIQKDENLKEIPVIILTSDKAQEAECLELGACDFISKPYPDAKIVLARIKRIIELFEEERIIKSTERDKVTHLFTHEYFYAYAKDYDNANKAQDMDAIAIKIRSFHMLKERFGHEYADHLLLEFANRLKSIMPEVYGMVSAKADGEFLVYCKHIDDYNKFFHKISDGLYIDEIRNTPLNIQMGVNQHINKELDMDIRFERAEMALNTIRSSAVENIALFDDRLREKEIYEEELIEDFYKALDERQFIIFYQPKFNIQHDEPVLSSAEALVRWKHPDLGMISPGVFIPLFEENGLIEELDLYIWREVGRQIREWKDKFNITLPVSVNVSRMDLYNPELTNNLVNIVKKNKLDFSDLLLEITESAWVDEASLILESVDRLKKAGFKIEMDDFGSGYSSLHMVSKMPLDALKIDMVFIKNMFADENGNQMIKIIIEIAKYLNVLTIAEGVETKEQVEVLRENGCDIVQGYYFSKPLPVSEFNKNILKVE